MSRTKQKQFINTQ